MASTALPHERGHGIANAAPWLFVFIAVSPPRATAPRPDLGAAPSQGEPVCAGCSDRYTEQGCQVAPPSSWIRSSGAPHRYGALLQRHEHLVFTNAFGRKPAEVAALLAGKLHGRDGVAVFRSALAVSAPSVPAPIAERICVPKPGRPRRRL